MSSGRHSPSVLPASSTCTRPIMARSAPAAISRGTMVNSQASSLVANITRDGRPDRPPGRVPRVSWAASWTHTSDLPMPSRPASRVSAPDGIRSGHSQRTGRGVIWLARVTAICLLGAWPPLALAGGRSWGTAARRGTDARATAAGRPGGLPVHSPAGCWQLSQKPSAPTAAMWRLMPRPAAARPPASRAVYSAPCAPLGSPDRQPGELVERVTVAIIERRQSPGCRPPPL